MNISVFTYMFVCFALLSFSGYALAGDIEGPRKADIEYENIEHGNFNKILLSASANGEKWTADPVLVSLRFIGPSEGMTQTIERSYDNPESPKTAQVIIQTRCQACILTEKRSLIRPGHELPAEYGSTYGW
jgi:hypothetical protein